MSRFIWLIIGAGAATWWTKHKSSRHGSTRNQSPPLSQSHPYNNSAAKGDVQYPQGAPETSSVTGDQQQTQFGWEMENDRIRDISKQAGDTVTELSMATLETLLTTVDTLKAKLAENRARREQEQRGGPPRYV
jgi:hypothetical protein